jgi:hypothetical protein
VRGFNPGHLQCPAHLVGAGREGRGPACFRPEAPGPPRCLRRRAIPGRRSDPWVKRNGEPRSQRSADGGGNAAAPGYRKARLVGSGLSTFCDVERLRRRRKPLGRSGIRSTSQWRKPSGSTSPCDLVHKDKTHPVLTKIPVFLRKSRIGRDGGQRGKGDTLAAGLQHSTPKFAQLLKVTAYA